MLAPLAQPQIRDIVSGSMILRFTVLRKVLFILTAMAFTGGTVSSFEVQQLSALNVMTGNTAVITCTYVNIMKWHTKARWTRNSTGPKLVDLENSEYSGRLNLSNLFQNVQGEAILSISDVRESDSDMYYCEIEVTDGNKSGLIKKGKGGGTKLRVIEDPKERRNHERLIKSFSIRCVLVFLLITSGLLGCAYSTYAELPEKQSYDKEDPPDDLIDGD